MVARTSLLLSLLFASGAYAQTQVTLPQLAEASPPAANGTPKTPSHLVPMSAMERLLVCKASYAAAAKRHLDAVSAQSLPTNQRSEAAQAASDAALAIAVLDDAVGDEVSEPEARHVAAALDKRERLSVVAYCGQTLAAYVNIRMRSSAKYLTELKPNATQVLEGLSEALGSTQATASH